MILRADAILASMQSSEEAATIYRQVVRLFPTTGSAELAKERLMKAGFSAEDI
jgi:TolA-binding protein